MCALVSVRVCLRRRRISIQKMECQSCVFHWFKAYPALITVSEAFYIYPVGFGQRAQMLHHLLRSKWARKKSTHPHVITSVVQLLLSWLATDKWDPFTWINQTFISRQGVQYLHALLHHRNMFWEMWLQVISLLWEHHRVHLHKPRGIAPTHLAARHGLSLPGCKTTRH